MSTTPFHPADVATSRAIVAHDGVARASVNAVNEQAGVIQDQVNSIKSAVSSLRGDSDFAEKHKGELDSIDGAADQIGASKNALAQSVKDVSDSSASLAKTVPSTDENPYVSPGQANGTATHPGTDDVREDPRNSQKR